MLILLILNNLKKNLTHGGARTHNPRLTFILEGRCLIHWATWALVSAAGIEPATNR